MEPLSTGEYSTAESRLYLEKANQLMTAPPLPEGISNSFNKGLEMSGKLGSLYKQSEEENKAREFEKVLATGVVGMKEFLEKAKKEGYDVSRISSPDLSSKTAEQSESWWKKTIGELDRQNQIKKIGTALRGPGGANEANLQSYETGAQNATPTIAFKQDAKQKAAEQKAAEEKAAKEEQDAKEREEGLATLFDNESGDNIPISEMTIEQIIEEQGRLTQDPKYAADKSVVVRLKTLEDAKRSKQKDKQNASSYGKTQDSQVFHITKQSQPARVAGTHVATIHKALHKLGAQGGIYQSDLSVMEVKGVGVGGKYTSKFINDPKNAEFMQALNFLLGQVRKNQYGATLTGNEKTAFEDQSGTALISSPELLFSSLRKINDEIQEQLKIQQISPEIYAIIKATGQFTEDDLPKNPKAQNQKRTKSKAQNTERTEKKRTVEDIKKELEELKRSGK